MPKDSAVYCLLTLITVLVSACANNANRNGQATREGENVNDQPWAPRAQNTTGLAHTTEHRLPHDRIQLGPRPFFLVENMAESELKRTLQQCADGPFYKTDFSIGHRGAPLQFPEHTRQSYEAAARMGAGILECDVTFTKDRQLVCRHSQCDLHTTTNILAVPELAAKCTQPFKPADPVSGAPASARCCTSDITLQEFKSLCGKMDASNPVATTVEAWLNGTADWRTDLYSNCGELLSHRESIALFKQLGVKFTPELKAPSVTMPDDYTRQHYAQQMIDEYKAAGIPPRHVWPQSFSLDDLRYWIKNEPLFAHQAIYLDDRMYTDPDFVPTLAGMKTLADEGVRIVAPPLWALLELDRANRVVPSDYARFAKAAGLDIITWTLERSGPLQDGGGWYYQSIAGAIDRDGDKLEILDILAREVGIIGMFSDWPATTTFYANCLGLK